jgi:uncharacterized protein YggL (DUF469 family)
MRRRIRKKKHIGEFQEFGVEVAAKLKSAADLDAFLDDFILNAVEVNGLAFGGGGLGARFSGFVELGRRGVHTSNLEKVTAWLAKEGRIESYQVGEPVDAWYAA